MKDAPLPDATDLRILDALQDDIPLVPRPFEAIALRLGISGQVLLDRLKRLQDEGIVRGISPILESRHMGLSAATLIALHVPGERIHEIAAIISGYPEVSHNFRRDHYYTLWFTLSGKNEEDIRSVLTEIQRRTGTPDTDILNLPTVRKLKVDVRFSLMNDEEMRDTDGSA
ncbi:MAG: AsnC family transcriptional regulator [Methanoregulaceae archaeon]|nr:AsnC family transcriptional regulator [Methanoregulaceae archaeon]